MEKFNVEMLNEFLNKLVTQYGDIKEVDKQLGHSSGIARLFLEQHKDVSISQNALASMILNRITNPENLFENEQEKINIGVDEKKRYSFAGNVYSWTNKRGENIVLTLDEADNLFYHYSQYGLNLSSAEMRRKFKLSNSQWYSICYALCLYKSANVISPERENQTLTEEQPQLYSDMFNNLDLSQQDILENESNNYYRKKYQKEIKEANKKSLDNNILTNTILENLPEVQVLTKIQQPTKPSSPKEIIVAIADLHIGAKVTKPMHHTPEFDIDIIKERLNSVAVEVNKINAKKVTLSILGDLIESFSGLNHPNSWKGIGFGLYGGNLYKVVTEILTEFVQKIANIEDVYIISGNHDRVTASNKEDRRGEFADMISYMLSISLKDIVNIHYDPLIITHATDNTQYIFIHGDKKVIRKEHLDQTYMEYSGGKKNVVVLAGHLHSRSVVRDTRYLRWYQCPSIFSGNAYSEENAWNARPGFTIVQETQDGLPIITDYTLKD